MSRTQPAEDKEVKNLPSWVPDLSVGDVDFFESEESYLSACTHKELYILDFEGNVMIFAASPFDRIVSIGESFDEIQDFGSLVKFLTVFLDVGPVYEHTKEKMLVVMRRTLIADTLDLDSQDEVALMKKEYDMQAALDQWLFRLVCYCLRADPEGSDSGSESGSDSGSGSGSGSEDGSEGGSNGEWSTDQEKDSDGPKSLGSEATTTVEDLPAKVVASEQLHLERLTNLTMEPPIESQDVSVETKIEAAEPASASSETQSTTPSRALRRAAAASRKSAREALLETFLSDPPGTLHASMSILGFPDPSTYSLLEPAILRGAASCQHKMADFPVDELFSHMWCAGDPYASSWFYTMRNKVPFRTEKGFVGIGAAVEVGDEIFWVEGAASMYVLRPREKKGDGEYSSPREEKQENLWPTSPVTDRGSSEKMEVPLLSPVEPETTEVEEPVSEGVSEATAPKDKEILPPLPESPIGYPAKKSKLKQGAQPKKASEREEGREDDSEEAGADAETSSSSGSSEDSYEEGGDFTLGGEVYVHGLMCGEAFKDGKGDDIVFQKVRIY